MASPSPTLLRQRPAWLPESLTVRGVTVACGPHGFEAVARGYFPLSETGFRSYSGLLPLEGEPAEALVELDARLDARAYEQSRGLAAATVTAVRAYGDAPKLQPGVVAYVQLSGPGFDAIRAGLFAPDHDRLALWSAALSLLDLIQAEERYQPRPTDGTAWHAAACAAALDRVHVQRFSLGLALAGNVVPLAEVTEFCSYAELPARPGGEPVFVGAPPATRTPSTPRPDVGQQLPLL